MESMRGPEDLLTIGPFTCQQCGKEFQVKNTGLRRQINSGAYSPKFCSHECYWESKKGGRLSRGARVCSLLTEHHETLKDDPERLSTDFLKSLIGGVASECEESE